MLVPYEKTARRRLGYDLDLPTFRVGRPAFPWIGLAVSVMNLRMSIFSYSKQIWHGVVRPISINVMNLNLWIQLLDSIDLDNERVIRINPHHLIE
jgi:hypothetical protein